MKAVISIAFLMSLSLTQAHADTKAELADYVQASNSIIQNLQVMKQNAGSCGIIGSFVASKMEASIGDQRSQMNAVVDAANRGGSAGRSAIQQKINEMEQGNSELRSSSGMIRNGLSTNSPTCKQASAAFERMAALSLSIPHRMQNILNSL